MYTHRTRDGGQWCPLCAWVAVSAAFISFKMSLFERHKGRKSGRGTEREGESSSTSSVPNFLQYQIWLRPRELRTAFTSPSALRGQALPALPRWLPPGLDLTWRWDSSTGAPMRGCRWDSSTGAPERGCRLRPNPLCRDTSLLLTFFIPSLRV